MKVFQNQTIGVKHSSEVTQEDLLEGASVVAQWFGLSAFTTEGTGLIPGWVMS